MDKNLSKSELLVELHNRKGLIPIELDTENSQVKWMDLESYHFYEGFFHKSLKMYSTLKGRKEAVSTFNSSLDVLTDDRILNDNLYPTGFIFHAGRCGSTLLAKIFACLRKNLVLSEVSIHNQFWLEITGNGKKTIYINEENKRLYKNLLLATARRRLASHKYCFIKFTSFNIYFYEFIRSVFPDVPSIFLFRQPSEILSSFKKNPPDWIEIPNETIRELLTRVSMNEFLKLKPETYKVKILENLFSAAIKNRENTLNFLNFNNLNAESFAETLKIFQTDFTPDEFNKMKLQFDYYSKSENKLIKFSDQINGGKIQPSKQNLKYSLKKLQELYEILNK